MAELRDLIRPNITQIPQYHPGRPTDDEVIEKGIAKLASNENPLPPPEPVLQRMREMLERVRLYPDAECERLTQALAERLDVAPECIIVGRGSDEVIHMLGLAFLNPGDEVIMPKPPFTLYPSTTLLMGATPVMIPWKNYQHDLEAMAEAVTERTKLIFVANPDNPTGAMATAQQIAAFMDRVPEDVIVAFDEAYFEYVDDPQFPDSLEYVRAGRPVIVLRTFSKIYSLAGLRIGYGVAPEELIHYLKLVREPFNVTGLAQEAAIASLEHPELVQERRRETAEGKAYLYNEFDRLGLPYIRSHANFVFVNLGVDVQAAFEALLERGVTIRVAPGGWPDGHVRVTVGTPEQNRRFIAALEEALPQLPKVQVR